MNLGGEVALRESFRGEKVGSQQGRSCHDPSKDFDIKVTNMF